MLMAFGITRAVFAFSLTIRAKSMQTRAGLRREHDLHAFGSFFPQFSCHRGRGHSHGLDVFVGYDAVRLESYDGADEGQVSLAYVQTTVPENLSDTASCRVG